MAAKTTHVHSSSSWPKDLRPSVTRHTSSMWGDIFSSFSWEDEERKKHAEAIEALKDEARSILMANGNTKSDKLLLIDILERLGVAYHFEDEIEEQLHQIFKLHSQEKDHQDFDLFITALEFRLLRQHRYHISSGIFHKFMGKNNKFKETLSSDVKGLLSLYEAAQVKRHGEETLEEALSFTTHLLNLKLQQLESPLKDKVKRALEQPFHKGVPRTETRHYISLYEKDDSKNELLLNLAKLDFNYLQNMYRKEIYQLSRWWKEFELKSKLPYARDRVVECYYWGVALHFEPQYADVRIVLAKVFQMLTVVDDTYDNYATLEDADLFTEIVERWDIDEIDQLPDYMKTVYRFVLSIYEDLEHEAAKQGKLFALPYAKETVKQSCKAYNKELKWLLGRQMPTFEDYVANMHFTSCLYVALAAMIPYMKSASTETVDWLMSEPEIVIASAKMTRFLNDIGSYDRENKQGETLTAMDCYMKHYGASMEETIQKISELVEDGWKDINKEWIAKASIAKDIVEMVLNFARSTHFSYKNRKDGFSNPEVLGTTYVDLFINSIII